MQNAFPDITDQHREFLKKQGLKVYQPAPLHDSLNPFAKSYWLNNTLMFVVALLGRRHAAKVQAPRIFWSAAIVGIPLSAIVGRTRLDSLDEIAGARKTLDQKLEQAPITRRAWERALQTNAEYQQQLKDQIQDLQVEISLKKSQASN